MNQKYFEFLKNRFPDLSESAAELISDKLVSPYTVELPVALLEQAQVVVKQLYGLRETTAYQAFVQQMAPESAQADPGNKSICMSYDFHVDDSGQLKLIEINTNAAFLLMGFLLYQCKQAPLPIPDFSLNEFFQNCKTEAALCNLPFANVAIVDEAPSSQRLFIEFLLYEQLFKEFGCSVSINDPKDIQRTADGLYVNDRKIDFIYNRTTDFYLDHENSSGIRAAYLNHQIALSPNPHEYLLLADKKRLIEWSLELRHPGPFYDHLAPIRNNLLETDYLTQTNSAEIWGHKKKYFFKPLTSFGSKGSYRGEGISRSYFDQLINNNCLAQEYCPPDERVFEAPGFPSSKLKYDLRFYAYQDRVQLVVARLYQGQVTNLRTPLGGFAPVVFR
jgi:hypothetical protein